MACRCAPSLVALRNEINAAYPNRDKASDGCCGDAAHATRKSDHNADASGYAHALDIDEDLFSGAGPRPLWDTLRPILLADGRTKYLIYERRIMYPDGTDKPYTGVNAHDHHLHLSIKSTATHDTRRWLPPTVAPDPQEDVLMRDPRLIEVPDGDGLVWDDTDGKALGSYDRFLTAHVVASNKGDATNLRVEGGHLVESLAPDALFLRVTNLDGTPTPAGRRCRVILTFLD